MPVEAIESIPSYERDFAQLGADFPDELDTFDHLGAYQKLGPIYSVRFRGEDWVCIGGMEANAAAWKNPDIWNYQMALSPFREIMGPQHVTQLDGAEHREKRRQLKPGFAMSRIASCIPEIDRVVKERLGLFAGKAVSLHTLFMTSLTYANAATVLQADLDEKGVSVFIRFEEEFIKGTIMDTAEREAWYTRPQFLADKEFVFEFLKKEIQSRLDGKVVDDNFTPVLERTLEGREEVAMQELVSEAYLLLMAGTGNTAKLLNCGLQNILQDEAWLGELREEVSGYGAESFLRGMDAFPKLKATIMEIERLFPAAPVLSRVVENPFEFQGFRLEKGTKVLHLQTITHFLEEIYDEPYCFKPQRWLNNSYDKKAHGTFGGSTHICLGMNLARIHMPIALANLLNGYELEFTSDSKIEVNLNYGVPQVADLEAVLKAR